MTEGQVNDLKYDLLAVAQKYGVQFGGRLVVVPNQVPALTFDLTIGGDPRQSTWIIEEISEIHYQNLVNAFTPKGWKISRQENGAVVQLEKSQDEDALVEWCEKRELDVNLG